MAKLFKILVKRHLIFTYIVYCGKNKVLFYFLDKQNHHKKRPISTFPSTQP